MNVPPSLKRLTRELEAFTYSVSHDLRAPLRAIDGYTRILLDEYQPLLDAEGKRVCSVISESAHKMSGLIDDLLTFSRLGRSAINPSKIDMETLANSVFQELTTPQSRKRINFQVDSAPPVMGDPALLRQVWVNLHLQRHKVLLPAETCCHQGARRKYGKRDCLLGAG